jgi:hypothetical protein
LPGENLKGQKMKPKSREPETEPLRFKFRAGPMKKIKIGDLIRVRDNINNILIRKVLNMPSEEQWYNLSSGIEVYKGPTPLVGLRTGIVLEPHHVLLYIKKYSTPPQIVASNEPKKDYFFFLYEKNIYMTSMVSHFTLDRFFQPATLTDIKHNKSLKDTHP